MESVRKEKTRAQYRAHDCLIYFVDRDERNWWDWLGLTSEGFRHCFLMQWCEWSQRWILIDWRQSSADFIILFDFEATLLLANIFRAKGTVVRYRVKPAPDKRVRLITYCSNMISRFLGLGDSIVLTPYGLYRRLLASGGEVVFRWSDNNEHKTQANGTAETA